MSTTRDGMISLWAAVAMWGSTGLLIAAVSWDIGSMNFVRGLGALVTLLLFIRTFPIKVGKRQMLGAVCCAGSTAFFTVSVRESNPAAAIVWLYTGSLHTAIHERLVRKRALPGAFWLALPLAVIGLVLIAGKDLTEGSVWGHVSGAAAGLCFGSLTLCRDEKADGKDIPGILFWAFLLTVAVFAYPFAKALCENRLTPVALPLGASLLYGVFTAASWILLLRALKVVRPTAALVILAAEVPLVPLGAALVTGVWPHIQVVIGGTMVLAASLGLSFATMKKQKSA